MLPKWGSEVHPQQRKSSIKKNVMKELLHKHNLPRKILNSSMPLMLRQFLKFLYKKEKADQSYWAGRPEEGERGATNYIDMDATGRALIDEVEKRAINKEAGILDLGCNVGRHLNALRERGFHNLYGVDLSKAARKVSKDVFPALNEIAEFEEGSFEAYLSNSPSKKFDVVYTHGATIEHVNPVFPLVQEICRVTKHCVVLGAVYYNGSTYPRFWTYEFEKNGFYLCKLMQPEKEWAPDSKTNRPCVLAVYKRCE